MTDVTVPSTTAELDHVRRLMRAFIAWPRERHREDRHLIDAYFDDAAFESEPSSATTAPVGEVCSTMCIGVLGGCMMWLPVWLR